MERQKKKQKGITLIALVISIIVMLILAGVSLNMTVGDNGIISQAQNATIEQKCAELEEYLQQFYVRNYDNFSDTSSKIAAIKSLPISKDWIYAGKLGYILDSNGNVHYYLNEDNLSKEMKDIIGTWTKKSYADYVNGNDCYGITEDLKVYYQMKKGDGTFDYYGIKDPQFGQENGDAKVFDSTSAWAKVVGKTGDIKTADCRSVTDLSINSSSGLTDLSEIYNFVGLRKLVLSNVQLTSLDGLEYCTQLTTIFVQNSTINNYAALAKMDKLEQLYFYNITDSELEKICNENVRSRW